MLLRRFYKISIHLHFLLLLAESLLQVPRQCITRNRAMRFLDVQACSKEIIQSELLLNRTMQRPGAEGFSKGTWRNMMGTVSRHSSLPNRVRLPGIRGSALSVRPSRALSKEPGFIEPTNVYSAAFYIPDRAGKAPASPVPLNINPNGDPWRCLSWHHRATALSKHPTSRGQLSRRSTQSREKGCFFPLTLRPHR